MDFIQSAWIAIQPLTTVRPMVGGSALSAYAYILTQNSTKILMVEVEAQTASIVPNKKSRKLQARTVGLMVFGRVIAVALY
jgi:hypothetical protein